MFRKYGEETITATQTTNKNATHAIDFSIVLVCPPRLYCENELNWVRLSKWRKNIFVRNIWEHFLNLVVSEELN